MTRDQAMTRDDGESVVANGAADWVGHDPERAHTLPSRYFYDADIFEREKQSIFYGAWHPVAHKNQLAEPGSFVTLDIFDQSVIVVAAKDGQTRAFHNVCQHRGNRLIMERRGTLAGPIRCSYHGWCYAPDGRLAKAPRCERLKDFNQDDYGLKPVRLEEFASFLFVNLDNDATPIAEQMPGADDALRRHCPDLDALAFHSATDFLVDANWKVVIDNAIEGYHFGLSGPVHKILADLIVYDEYTMTPHGDWWTFAGPSKPGLTHAFGEPVDGASYQTSDFFNIQLWPNNIFYCFPYSDFLGTFLIIPLEPEKTLLHLDYYVPPRAMNAMNALTKSCLNFMNEQLGPEDIDLNVSVQKGLRSFGYDRGRYVIDAERSNVSEHLVHHFHSLVHQRIWS